MFGIDKDTMIVLISSVAAFVSFAVFALPFLQREEKKSRYRQVIEQKRKKLYKEAKEKLENKGGGTETSARDSVATFFKAKRLTGGYGEKVKVQLLQAGIRSPMAPVVFLVTQLALPVFFVLLSMLFISASDKELSSAAEMMILLAAMGCGFFLPPLLVKNQAMKREQEINVTFPDALDMMLICVQGGIGIEQTIDRVAEEVAEHSPILAEELGILSAEMSMLSDRREALSDFGKRVGGYGKSFATALIQAEQYGTSISQALRVMSDELREIRMSNAEEKAASLPPKLTVPMILFFLPALFIVILGPAGIEASSAGLGK